MANTVYAATSLTGGGPGALDAINGGILGNSDSAIVIDYSELIVYVYTLDETSGLPESPPDIIAPDTNPASKRWILTKSGLLGGPWDFVDTNVTAKAGDKLMIDSTSVSTITLPTNPSPMDSISLGDAKGTFSSSSVIVDPGTLKIRGLSETLELDVDWVTIELIYVDSSTGWRFEYET